TTSRVAREIAARVASSGHSAKNTRCRPGRPSGASFIAYDELDEPLERERDSQAPNRLAAAGEDAPRGRDATRRGPGDVHRDDGLVGAAPVGTCDTADGAREIRREAGAGTLGHRAHGLFGDGAVRGEHVARHPEQRDFRRVRIGDDAAVEPLRAASDVGQGLGDPAAGARFGRRHARAALLQRAPELQRQRLEIAIRGRHSSPTVAVAAARSPRTRLYKEWCAVTSLLTSKRRSTCCRAAAPRRARSSREESNARSARAMAAASSPGTRRPVSPSATTSGTPPTAHATTGTPALSASSSASPRPSRPAG